MGLWWKYFQIHVLSVCNFRKERGRDLGLKTLSPSPVWFLGQHCTSPLAPLSFGVNYGSFVGLL